MSTTITGKLNKSARTHEGADYTIFFINIGTQIYDKRASEKVWTNYEVALFAKGGQIQFYTDSLIEGAIVSVSGTGLILRPDENGVYEPKLELQDSKLEYVHSGQQSPQSAPQQSQRPYNSQQQPQQPQKPTPPPMGTFEQPQEQPPF